MQPERVVIARVSTVIAAVVATTVIVAVVVAAAARAFGSLLLGHLIPNVKIVIVFSGGRPRAQATIVGVVATPIVLGLEQHLLVVLPLHDLDVRRPSNGRRDLLSFDGVARCNSSGRDMPSTTDAGGPLDLDG
jgi:hypothetical protein